MHTDIDEQVQQHTMTIQSTFKEFHALLTQRETQLIKTLNVIANKKKQKLQSASNTLTQQCTQSEQVKLLFVICVRLLSLLYRFKETRGMQ